MDGKVLVTQACWTPETQASYGYLYLRYRPACWLFEFFAMARKNALAAPAILFSENAVVASGISVALLVVSILMQRQAQAIS